jgi:hypothetical protein
MFKKTEIYNKYNRVLPEWLNPDSVFSKPSDSRPDTFAYPEQ